MGKKLAIGVDIGGTNLRVALVSEDGLVVRKIKEPSTSDPRAALKAAINGIISPEVAGIGIGVAGILEKHGGCISFSGNLPALKGFCFSELAVGLPVFVENDANAAALGESWMAPERREQSFVLLTLGTGIGGGYVHRGSLMQVPFEVGHASIVADGAKCPCGNYGCLEMYASARAVSNAATKSLEDGRESLLKEAAKGNIYNITPEDIYKAAFEGDALARDLLKNAGRYLGVGIANLIHLLSPDAIVLAGGLTGAWDFYVEEAKHEASKRVIKNIFERTAIVRSALGPDDAGVIGAASLVFHDRQKS